MERAKHRLEVAADLVCDVKRMEQEAEGIEGDSTRSKKISPLQVKEMVHGFNLFDRNQDGSLDKKELGSVFRALGQNPTDAELEKIIKEADKNGNGLIEKDEFVLMLTQHMQSKDDVVKDLEQAFKAFDRDGSDTIDKTELMRVLCKTGDKLSETEAEEMIELMGGAESSEVNIKEFTAFLCSDFPEAKEQEPDPSQNTQHS